LGKIVNKDELITLLSEWHNTNRKIVFTNGCFDLIHRGHVEYLNHAKSYGDLLLVGINSDESVRRIKGKNRPFINEKDRAYILTNLVSVDYVFVFNEDTPYDLIKLVEPDILVKGSDYSINEIVGRDIVEKNGGSVIRVPLINGKSTTGLVEKIRKQSTL
jgi:rfaE bifunctional protein nucleotidyltransferase chain/domain